MHPIFNIGLSRGGPHEFGGIFWEDLRELLAFPGPDTIKQVVGHTPLPSITKFHSGKITGIDVGLFEGYGGNRAYLKIENKVPSFIELRVSSPYDAQAQFTPRKG
ncbi:MAG: hypothetical protein NTW04_00440 [Elusimicrobia bacterium]|nr:hypothetical protein [Elusimicrobiota bacterium]